MGLYEEFEVRKRNFERIDINELTPEVLRILFIEEEKTDNMIANLFDVKPTKITYLRRKNGITIRNSIIDDFINNIPEKVQEKAKHELLSQDNLTKIAKAITHFAFRNGPIEDMHADGEKNITEEDMKKLNKFMVNRIAYIVNLIKEEKWFELNFLIESTDRFFGHQWDNAELDDGGIEDLMKNNLIQFRN